MSFFDKFRKQASDVVGKHGDKINEGLEKAANKVDERTGGKHTDKIDKGVTKAKEGLGKLDDKNDGDAR
ncbi:MAG TPA: antitoxin [Nocardioidaceae bacterium]|nr:antitoxin [Nocardioidaceae bacterium]